MRVKCGCIFTRISMRIQSLSSLPELNPLCLVYKDLSHLSQVNDPFCPSEAMGLARITAIFSVISSLFLLSQARYVLADFSSATVTVWDPAEDTDRKAIAVPLEKPSSSAESPPAVEGFHHVVDLSLRRPIDRQFLPRETPHGSGRIGFPGRLRGEMRWIPTRRTPEADDVVGKLVEAMAQDLTEEAKERIPVEWKAKEEEEEEEHKRKKKKKRDHKKKKDREEDSDSDSDSDSDEDEDSDSDSDEDEDSDSDSDEEEEEKKEIKKKNKSAKHKKGVRVVGGLMKRFWAFVNRF